MLKSGVQGNKEESQATRTPMRGWPFCGDRLDSVRMDDEFSTKRLTSKAYDRWARIWNLARHVNGAVYETTLQCLNERHQRILDVGCGTGLMNARLAASGRRVLGVDISPAMLERARQERGPLNEYVQGDAERLPAANQSFDAVVNVLSFHHYPNPARAAAEFRRVLKPGGRLVLVSLDRDSLYIRLTQNTNGWTKRLVGTSWQKTKGEIVSLLREAGFMRTEVVSIPYVIKVFAVVAE